MTAASADVALRPSEPFALSGSAAPSELRLRVLSAIVLVAIALISAWLGGWLLVLVWGAAAIMVGREWIELTRLEPRSILQTLMAISIALVLLVVILQSSGDFIHNIFGVLLVLPLLFTGALIAGGTTSSRDGALMLAGLLYATPIAVVPYLLRSDPANGMWPLLWMFAVVWTTDVVAYFVGRAVGGPKLWPAVSPKKTWSGFVGGLVGAVLAGTALAAFASTKDEFDLADVVTIISLSALASVASQGGDLAESAMKRHFGVKDSGHLIPGHGGFMDRLDGFAAVAILVCLLLPLAKFSLWTVAP